MVKSALLLLVLPAFAAAAEDPAAEALAFADANDDGTISAAELDMITPGPPCPSGSELLALANATEGLKTPQQVQTVMTELFLCSRQSLPENVTVMHAGKEYACSAKEQDDHDDHDHAGHDHDHDDHDHAGHDHAGDEHDHAGDEHEHAEDDEHDHDHGSGPEVAIGNNMMECLLVETPAETLEVTGATWGAALGAVALASLTSLLGVFLIVLLERKKGLELELLNDLIAFAIGVLAATVFIHMLPEAVAYNGSFSWEIGVTFLAGIIAAFSIEIVSGMMGQNSHHHHDMHDASELKKAAQSEQDDQAGQGSRTTDLELSDAESTNPKHGRSVTTTSERVKMESRKRGPVNHSLVANIVVGDGFHNFTDGILIGIAFLGCAGSGLGWIVTGAVLVHEIPQELVDFVILVRAGLSYKAALLWNLASSLTSVFGVVLILGLGGSLSKTSEAYMLALGSGFLAYIALAELTPMIVAEGSAKRKALRFALVILGCVVIGLLGLFHPHCEAGGHSHAGHNH